MIDEYQHLTPSEKKSIRELEKIRDDPASTADQKTKAADAISSIGTRAEKRHRLSGQSKKRTSQTETPWTGLAPEPEKSSVAFKPGELPVDDEPKPRKGPIYGGVVLTEAELGAALQAVLAKPDPQSLQKLCETLRPMIDIEVQDLPAERQPTVRAYLEEFVRHSHRVLFAGGTTIRAIQQVLQQQVQKSGLA